MMNCLRDANLLLQLDKCEFLRREVAHLDYIIGNKGMPNPEKIAAVKNFPVRRKVKNIKHSWASYYHHFIPNFSGKFTSKITDQSS